MELGRKHSCQLKRTAADSEIVSLDGNIDRCGTAANTRKRRTMKNRTGLFGMQGPSMSRWNNARRLRPLTLSSPDRKSVV